MVVTVGLVVALLAASGCGTSTASLTKPGVAHSTSTTSAQDILDELKAIDPCTLITEADVAPYGAQKRDDKWGPAASDERHCDWSWCRYPDDYGRGSFSIGLSIWDDHGLKDIIPDGYIVTDNPIGSHPGKQLHSTAAPDGCSVMIGVTDTSRVQVVVVGADETCEMVNHLAELVEPRLPGGGE